MISDDTKLNCAGEFMSSCESPHQLFIAIMVLAEIAGESNCEFAENLSEALQFAVGEAKRNTEKDEDENIGDILEFCHAYLAKAYEKKVGRA